MVTANQESIMHTKMGKKSKHNTKYSHQIQENKREKENKIAPQFTCLNTCSMSMPACFCLDPEQGTKLATQPSNQSGQNSKNLKQL